MEKPLLLVPATYTTPLFRLDAATDAQGNLCGSLVVRGNAVPADPSAFFLGVLEDLKLVLRKHPFVDLRATLQLEDVSPQAEKYVALFLNLLEVSFGCEGHCDVAWLYEPQHAATGELGRELAEEMDLPIHVAECVPVGRHR
jgi:hypothetical protein